MTAETKQNLLYKSIPISKIRFNPVQQELYSDRSEKVSDLKDKFRKNGNKFTDSDPLIVRPASETEKENGKYEYVILRGTQRLAVYKSLNTHIHIIESLVKETAKPNGDLFFLFDEAVNGNDYLYKVALIQALKKEKQKDKILNSLTDSTILKRLLAFPLVPQDIQQEVREKPSQFTKAAGIVAALYDERKSGEIDLHRHPKISDKVLNAVCRKLFKDDLPSNKAAEVAQHIREAIINDSLTLDGSGELPREVYSIVGFQKVESHIFCAGRLFDSILKSQESSMREMSNRTGIGINSLEKFQSGEGQPSLHQVEKLKQFFSGQGIDKDRIVQWERTVYRDRLIKHAILEKFPEDIYKEIVKTIDEHWIKFNLNDMLPQSSLPPKNVSESSPENHSKLPIWSPNARKAPDYAERDARNRELGKAGERLVLEFEKKTLREKGKTELEKKVVWVSEENGDANGFDILSCTPDGEDMYIEVKTTEKGVDTPFFLSAPELKFAEQFKNRYYIYRVYEFNKTTEEGKIEIFKGDVREKFELQPANYRVTRK